jgi:UDP-N-acetylglucosamine 2-epimerase (non-hydrolysing)
MPEEINRLVTDQLSDLLFTTEESANHNLRREGIAEEKIHFVGNVMIDTLLRHRDAARAYDLPGKLGLVPRGYAVLTLHRPSNVDDDAALERMLAAIAEIGRDVPIVFPVHPRTRTSLMRSPRAEGLIRASRLRILEPLGYLEFLSLMSDSRAVLTDSGGIQEETTVLGIPCLTLRDSTERPVTITHGTNRLVGTEPDRIVAEWLQVRDMSCDPVMPPLWDGRAAERIIDVLRDKPLNGSDTLCESAVEATSDVV